MPGVSFIKCEFSEREAEDDVVNRIDENILNALKLAIYNESYTLKILLRKNPLLIAFTGYPEYPMTVIETEDFWICIEGKIYGKDYVDLKKELGTLLNDDFDNQDQFTNGRHKAAETWLLTTDGEFIIYALDKKYSDFIVLNDALGRLPLYYYYSDDRTKIIISWEMRIISSLVWNPPANGIRGYAIVWTIPFPLNEGNMKRWFLTMQIAITPPPLYCSALRNNSEYLALGI